MTVSSLRLTWQSFFLGYCLFEGTVFFTRFFKLFNLLFYVLFFLHCSMNLLYNQMKQLVQVSKLFGPSWIFSNRLLLNVNMTPGHHSDIFHPTILLKMSFYEKKLPFYFRSKSRLLLFPNFEKFPNFFWKNLKFGSQRGAFKNDYHFIRILHQMCCFSRSF